MAGDTKISLEVIAKNSAKAGLRDVEADYNRLASNVENSARKQEQIARRVPEQFSRATAAMTPLIGTVARFDNAIGRASYGLVQLGSVVAGGGIIGIGIAAITAAISAGAAVMAVYEQQAKTITSAVTSINKALAAQSVEAKATGATLAQLEERLRTFGLTASEVAREAIGAQLMAREGFGDRYAAEIKKLEDANERLRASMTRAPHRRGSGAGAALAEIEAAKKQIELNDVAIEGLRKGLELAKANNEEDKKKLATLNQIMDLESKKKLSETTAKSNKEDKADAERAAMEIAAIDSKWLKKARSDEMQIRLEAAEDLKKIGKDNVEARIAIEQGLSRRLAEIESQHNQKSLEKTKQHADKITDAILSRRLRALILIQNHEEKRLAREAELAQQKEEREKRMVSDIADAWGDAFVSIATGSEKAYKAMLIAVIRSARSAVMAYAAQAAAGAASSQSGIPVVGPVLAVSAAGALFAVVEAMVSRIPSASGGFDVPAGMNPLTQLHEKEMVLPARIANPLRDSLQGGGFGGSITLNISAMDGASVERVVQDPNFWRGVREAQRNGYGGRL